MVEVTENKAKQRETAAYARHVAWLRHTQPNLSDEEMDVQALQKVDESVYGVGAKKDRNGNFIPQGIGSPGNENGNHYAAILKYQGRDAYNAAVAEIFKRDPNRARQLGLQQPART
jgi:hypothetical protein